MSILSSANSGKLRVATNELSNIFKNGVKFETYTDKEDGQVYVKLKPEQWNGPIYIQGNTFPCKISKFEAAPVLHLVYFNESKHFSILPLGWQGQAINFTFQNCQFSESTFAELINYADHIERSEIYLPPVYLKNGGVPYIEYFENQGIETVSLLYDLCKKENTIYILRNELEPEMFSPRCNSFDPMFSRGMNMKWYELTKDEIHSLFMYNERYKRQLEQQYLENKHINSDIIFPEEFDQKFVNTPDWRMNVW